MPPNVKGFPASIASLDLTQHLESKYPPLTSEVASKPQKLEASSVIIEREEKAPDDVNASYWDFPSAPITVEEKRAAIIDDILKKEEIRVALSASSIKDILVSSTRKDVSSEVIEGDLVEEEGYWDMPSEDEYEVGSHVDHTCYWDWDSSPKSDDEKRSVIEKVMREEEIRVSLSGRHIKETLVRNSRLVNDCKENCAGDEEDSYWTWHADDCIDKVTRASHDVEESYWDHPPVLESKEEKRLLIDAILKKEVIRKSLGISNLESKLKSESKERMDVGNGGREMITSSGDASYWDW